MSFADMITGLTVRTNKVVSFEPPKIWYHNGVRQAKTPGSFYTKLAEVPAGLGAPWASDDRFEGEQGYSTTALKIAVLAHRSQPFRKYKDADGRERIEYMPRWEKGMSIHTELLCLIEGHAEPVVWSMKGLTGAAVTGKGGILQSYRNGLLKEACRMAGQALPEWAFWLPIASKRTSDGKIAYEDTGFGSFITPPALHLPAQPLEALFGGQELIDRGEAALAQYPTWESFKRLPQNTTEGEFTVEAVPALPPGRNVPQPVTEADDDLF